MAIDWTAIKTEYLTTAASYRDLAAKYKVNQATIAQRGKKEDWVGKRKQMASDIQAKSLEAAEEYQVDRATKLLEASDLLMRKVIEYVERSTFDGLGATQSMKHLSGVLKDLKEIQAVGGGESNGVIVEMSEELEEYSK